MVGLLLHEVRRGGVFGEPGPGAGPARHPVIDDYAASSTALRSAWAERSHRQVGDPAKLGAAIVTLASAEHPPLHCVVGTDAVAWAVTKIAALAEELDRWRELSLSTDIEPEAAAA